MQCISFKPTIGQSVTFDTPEGKVTGIVIEIWEEQDMCVVESDDENFHSNHFVAYKNTI